MKRKIIYLLIIYALFNVNYKAKADLQEYSFTYSSSNESQQQSQNNTASQQNDAVYGFAPAKSVFQPENNYNTQSAPNNNSTNMSGFAPAKSVFDPIPQNSQYSRSGNTSSGTGTVPVRKSVQKTTNFTKEINKPGVKRYTSPSYTTPKKAVAVMPKKGRSSVTTANYANSTLEYYYYIPSSLVERKNKPYPLIVWVPGLDGDGESSLPEQFYKLADTKGYAILTPTFKFDEQNFEKRTSYQFPQAWSGQALLKILEKEKSNGLNYSKLYLAGFSAGGQFVSRFSFMKPEMVSACAILSSGARVKPEKNNGVKYFVGIGTMDDKYRRENAEIFNDAAQKLNIPIEYRQYYMEHDTNEEEMNDVAEFFEKVRNNSL